MSIGFGGSINIPPPKPTYDQLVKHMGRLADELEGFCVASKEDPKSTTWKALEDARLMVERAKTGA